MQRRVSMLLFALASTAPPLAASTVATDARASVSVAITWDALLRESAVAAVVTPIDSQSVWEDGRIYTYTHVNVDRAVAGDLATGGDAWVRTMGGVVGKIGQLVEGEAVFVRGQASLLFLHAGPAGTLAVTARGQGQFPIATADAQHRTRVVRSHSVGALMAPRVVVSSAPLRLAADVVHDRPLDDVVLDVTTDWGRTHAGP